MRKIKSIRSLIFEILLLLVVPGFVIFGLFSTVYGSNLLSERLRSEALSYEETLNIIFKKFTNETERLFDQVIEYHKILSRDEFPRVFKIINDHNIQIVNLKILDQKGKLINIIPLNPDFIGSDLQYTEFFEKAQDKTLWSDFFHSAENGSNRIALYKKANGLIYIFEIDFSHVYDSYFSSKMFKNFDFEITDNFGFVILTNNIDFILQKHRSDFSGLNEAEKGKFFTDPNGRELFVVKEKIEGTNWYLDISLPIDFIKGPIENYILVIILAFLSLVIVGFVVVYTRLTSRTREFKVFSLLVKKIDIQDTILDSFKPNTLELHLILESFKEMIENIRYREDTIIRLNKTLEEKVKKRTSELSMQNIELLAMQEKVIQAEKISTISILVAGVAHEINTPIGIGLTTISFIDNQLKKIEILQNSNTLTRSEFDEILKKLLNSTSLTQRNLERASRLVNEFKQLSVSHHRRDKEKVKITQLIQQCLEGLSSFFESRKITWSIDGDAQLEIQSYPDSIIQIITNLAMNSLKHGFNFEDDGIIAITVKITELNMVEIIYVDTGKGIGPDIKDRIFEPFFTTNKEGGNTGLGMNIVQNLVLDQFKGDIKVESKVGQGVIFTICFPT